MDDHDDMYDMMDEDIDDMKRGDQLNHHLKKIVYPPRLMVDFKSLGMNALKRYAQFYHLNVRDDYGKEDLAAMVARHFDCSLEVEEDESIVSFIQRIRNGERNPNKRSLSEKERKNQEKKRKKSASRKRQRDSSVSSASVHSTGHGSSNGSSQHQNGGGSSSASGGGSNTRGSSVDRKSSSGSSNSKPKKESSKKKDDNGEDNELYCVCHMPSYGNMIACDGKKCPNPSQWYHLECVGFSDGRHPDTWLCPECDPKGFAAFQSKKKKSKVRSKSPGSSK